METLTVPNGRKPKLVVFDVEGVLIPKNRLLFEVGKSLGLKPLLKILFFGFLYEIGVVPLKFALKRLFCVTRDAKMELFQQSLDKLPRMPNAKEVFDNLKVQGCKTALISSGLPTVLVQELAEEFGADYAVGVEAEVKDGVLTGEIGGDVTDPNGKLLALNKILQKEGLRPDECAVVADDRNNVSLFLKPVTKIGFNADFVVRMKADAVINGKLTKLVPLLNGNLKIHSSHTRNDVLREIIHVSGFFMPIITAQIGLPLAALIISSVIAMYTISEFLRINGKNLPIISLITRHSASQSELCEFTTAPLYFAFGILLTLLLFPAPASSAAIAAFTIGDSTASLVGGTLSKKALPFNRTKTLEGSLGGFLFAFLAALVFVSPWLALVAAAVAMTVEFLPLPVNDNLMIPLCTGLVLLLLI